MSSRGLQRLGELLREEGGLIATLLDGEPAQGGVRAAQPFGSPSPSPAVLAAAGPRAAASPAEYELLVEAIYEGYLLHYGSPRIVHVPEADLGLLAGDRLYALGLARLVALGDTPAVAELADTITLSALAQGAGEESLADAVWMAGAHAVGWGSSAAHVQAKELVCARSDRALEAMRTSIPAIPAPP